MSISEETSMSGLIFKFLLLLAILNGAPAIQKGLMKQIEKHLQWLGEHYLQKGDKLEITIQDIDMAGAM